MGFIIGVLFYAFILFLMSVLMSVIWRLTKKKSIREEKRKNDLVGVEKHQNQKQQEDKTDIEVKILKEEEYEMIEDRSKFEFRVNVYRSQDQAWEPFISVNIIASNENTVRQIVIKEIIRKEENLDNCKINISKINKRSYQFFQEVNEDFLPATTVRDRGLCEKEVMMVEFNVGDVVELKSGGPTMTIQRFDEEGNQAVCAWFKGNETDRKSFEIQSLKKVSEESEERTTEVV